MNTHTQFSQPTVSSADNNQQPDPFYNPVNSSYNNNNNNNNNIQQQQPGQAISNQPASQPGMPRPNHFPVHNRQQIMYQQQPAFNPGLVQPVVEDQRQQQQQPDQLYQGERYHHGIDQGWSGGGEMPTQPPPYQEYKGSSQLSLVSFITAGLRKALAWEPKKMIYVYSSWFV